MYLIRIERGNCDLMQTGLKFRACPSSGPYDLRPVPGKSKAVVFDYIDSKVGVLAASARSRRAVYDSPGR